MRKHTRSPIRLLTVVLVLAVCGCIENPQPGSPMTNFPVIDPNDPASIARWEASQYNYGNAKIRVVQLNYLHGTLGGPTAKHPTPVALQVYEAMSDGIKPEQETAIDNLIKNEAALHELVRSAIYDYYRETYPIYRAAMGGTGLFGGAGTLEYMLPEIKSGNELNEIVRFDNVYIHPVVDGSVAIGMDFVVPWDEEHGIGLQLVDGQVFTIGSAHEAFPIAGQ